MNSLHCLNIFDGCEETGILLAPDECFEYYKVQRFKYFNEKICLSCYERFVDNYSFTRQINKDRYQEESENKKVTQFGHRFRSHVNHTARNFETNVAAKRSRQSNLTLHKIIHLEVGDQMKSKVQKYHHHECSSVCKNFSTYNFRWLGGHNPLSKPIICGWKRLVFQGEGKKEIVYNTPCGKCIKNIADIYYHLRKITSKMSVDLFDFDPAIRVFAEFRYECNPDIADISQGVEEVPIPVINDLDNEKMASFNYETSRIPMEGVSMNLDLEFLCGCDCDDDCLDKTKCACWKLTLEGIKNSDEDSEGYNYRRLYMPVITGIYECNSRCKCKSTCLNRVVQNPVSVKLQVFKTLNCGWGVRCLNDVAKGSFICNYAGRIYTEDIADQVGIENGDEYFTSLDFIEHAERHKKDYEAEISGIKVFCDNSAILEEDGERSFRKLFGKNETVCIIDGKTVGNVGRFFNHSCSPNLFTQNVFVDTMDPRFPCISIFASESIRAGMELTIDYHYEIGSVPGQVLYCNCNSLNCMGRLL